MRLDISSLEGVIVRLEEALSLYQIDPSQTHRPRCVGSAV